MGADLKLGIHAAVQGWTNRAAATYDAISPDHDGPILWLQSENSMDAMRYPAATHLVRLPTPRVGESSWDYADRVHDLIADWYGKSSVLDIYFIPGNEPDYADGWDVQVAWEPAQWTGKFPEYAGVLRTRFSGIRIAAPALKVENTDLLTPGYAGAADALTVHCYWENSHPEDITNPNLGGAWGHAVRVANGLPVYVTEVNSVHGFRLDQVVAFLHSLQSVAGVCLYLADGIEQWRDFDVSPEDAAAVAAALALPLPHPDPQPTGGAYSGATDPRGPSQAGHARWVAYLARTNPDEAEAIVSAYFAHAPVIGYNPDLALAQMVLETGGATSIAWRTRRNPAGVAITADNVAGPDFQTIYRAVQAHLALLNCYYGGGDDPWGVLTSFGFGGFRMGFSRLDQMNGRWAVPGDHYGEGIARIANEALGLAPVSGRVTLEDIHREAEAMVGRTTTYEGFPEFGMCEQAREEQEERAGLPRVRYYTAARHGEDLAAAGRLRKGLPPRGAGVVWGRDFDPQGHIATASDYPLVITTHVSGEIRKIDGTAWYNAAGYLGYYIPEGVVQEDNDMALPIEGKADDGVYEYIWAVASRESPDHIFKTAIFNRWLELVKAGVPIGVPITEEVGLPGGRNVMGMSSGAAMTAIQNEQGEWVVYVN